MNHSLLGSIFSRTNSCLVANMLLQVYSIIMIINLKLTKYLFRWPFNFALHYLPFIIDANDARLYFIMLINSSVSSSGCKWRRKDWFHDLSSLLMTYENMTIDYLFAIADKNSAWNIWLKNSECSRSILCVVCSV